MPLRHLLVLLNEAAGRTGAAHFGLLAARRADVQDLGAFGHRILASACLGDAIDAVVRHFSTFHQAGEVDLRPQRDRALLCFEVLDPELPDARQDIEAVLMMLVHVVRAAAGPRWCPRGVSFQHGQPSRSNDLVRAFRAPVLFCQPWNAIEFDTDLMSLPLRGGSTSLARILDEYLTMKNDQQPAWHDLCAAVEAAVGRNLESGDLTVQAVAGQLGLGVRTLQRRLDGLGLRYSDLVDRTRRRAAFRYLKDDRTPISEVAFRLGYADVSSFNRAFARWTGESPGRFRRLSNGRPSSHRVN